MQQLVKWLNLKKSMEGNFNACYHKYAIEPVLPYLGFYPKILGIFKCDGIFLGIFFLAKILGFEKKSSKAIFDRTVIIISGRI